MDRRSWLWRKKSSDKSDKSPGAETESSGSISSHSERYSDEQDASRASPNHNTQSPEVTSKAPITQSPEVTSKVAVTDEKVNDNIKSLREKLSAALINISAKEDLVKQHAKVAEEAVSGWEKAETEAAALKQRLEAAAQKNLALEERLGHLDGALKECLRKLRQAREEQEQKIHEAVVRNTLELESTKLELENQLVELQTQFENAKAGNDAAENSDLHLRLEASEKKNSALKLELLSRLEELEMRTLERDLSTETAETASKQHLESIKKVARLEAECRKLKAMARKASSANDHKSVTASSVYIESLTDSQSDSGERLLALETDHHKISSMELNGCEPSCSDSWATALIAELDQFKSEKPTTKNLNTSSVEIDLMDDFLEMERLAAQTESGKHGNAATMNLQPHDSDNCQHKRDLEAIVERVVELEQKLEKVEVEKAELEVTLAENQEHLMISQDQLREAEDQLREAEEKLIELHRQLDYTNDSNQRTKAELEVAITRKEVMESQIITMDEEVHELRAKVVSLETVLEDERALSAEMTAKSHELEDELSRKRREAGELEGELSRKRREAELRKVAASNGESKIKQEKELAVAAGKLAECQKTIASLGKQLKSLATFEDFLIDSEHPLELNGDSVFSRKEESPPRRDFVTRTNTVPIMIPSSGSFVPLVNGTNAGSPQSSSSSSSSGNHSVTSEKSRNGFGKLFSRSKSAMRVENQ